MGILTMTSYPTLQLGASANVTLLASHFMCVGCLGELIIQVTLTNSIINPSSVFYLHFPSFFLPAIANDMSKMDCRFNLDPVNCTTDSTYPYRLSLTNSPYYLNPGDTFNITVYGFIFQIEYKSEV